MRGWMWTLACGVVAFACGGCGTVKPEPPLVPKTELKSIRVLVPEEATLTWTDSDCEQWAPTLRKQYAQTLAIALAEAGFKTITNPKEPHHTKAKLSFALSYCHWNYAGSEQGRVVLEFEPGRVFAAPVMIGDTGNLAGYDKHWERRLVRQTQESPDILALAEGGSIDGDAATVASATAAGKPASADTSSSSDFLAGSPQRNAYALVIGIEQYREVPEADGGKADAERFAAMAKQTLGIPEEQIKLAVDSEATRSDIEARIEWLQSNVPEGGKIYFFFSGHGAPDASAGTPYLLPYNGMPEHLDKTALKLHDVLAELQKTKAEQVVAMVDSCFSGAGGRSVLPKGARPLVRVKSETPPARLVLMTASSGAQISGPAPDGKGGLFTSVLTTAIGTGKADVDGDGQVSLKELADWVIPRVERAAKKANREQMPSILLGKGMKPAEVYFASGLPTQ